MKAITPQELEVIKQQIAEHNEQVQLIYEGNLAMGTDETEAYPYVYLQEGDKKIRDEHGLSVMELNEITDSLSPEFPC